MRTSLVLVLIVAATAPACGDLPVEGEVEATAQPLIVPDSIVGWGSPGGTLHNGWRHLAFTGTDKRLNVIRLVNGTWFKKTIPEKSNHGPALFSDGQLHLVWVGTDGRLNLLRSNDGENWHSKRTVGAGGDYGLEPALVSYQGALRAWVAFRNVALDQWGIIDGEFQQWGWVEESGGHVSAAVLGNDLVLGWLKPNGNFATKKFVPGAGWAATNTQVFFGLPHIFEAHSLPNTIMMAFRKSGNIGPKQIEFRTSQDAVNWNFHSVSPDTTDQRPFGLVQAVGKIEYVHRGTDNRLNWTTIDL